MLGELLKWHQDVWNWLRHKFGYILLFVSPLAYIFSIIMGNMDTILGGLDQLIATLENLKTTANANKILPAVATVWNTARYFCPVELCMYYMTSLLYLKVVATLVRILKSVIPTIG